MDSIIEDIIDLLQDKSNLLSPYRSVFVISSSCFFKMLSSVFLILIKPLITRHCRRDYCSWSSIFAFGRVIDNGFSNINLAFQPKNIPLQQCHFSFKVCDGFLLVFQNFFYSYFVLFIVGGDVSSSYESHSWVFGMSSFLLRCILDVWCLFRVSCWWHVVQVNLKGY